MATPANGPRAVSNDITLEYGIAQTFALRFITGKNVPSRYPGGRVMFSAIDERKLFLSDEDGSDFERALRELGVQPADFIRVTKVRMPRGGGHSLRVELVPDEASAPVSMTAPAPAAGRLPPQVSTRSTQHETRSTLERDLEASLQQRRQPRPPAPAEAIDRAATGITATTAQLCAAFMVAIDAMNEARKYSQRSGFGDIVFNSEDLRAVALSVYIGQQRGGR
jgi:hypothetical protein